MEHTKYRFWDKTLKYYINESFCLLRGDGTIWFNEGAFVGLKDDLKNNTDRILLEEFTGLLDKNGVEIYEGDIVKQSSYESGCNKELAVVEKYSTTDWRWGSYGTIHVALNVDYYKSTEVIGNINENPSILSTL